MVNKIIDLNVFDQETLDFILPGETIEIHIKKPTREQVIAISQLDHLRDEADAHVVYDRLDTLVLDILNHNTDERVITREYVESSLNVKMRVAVVHAFSAWIGGIELDPN